MSKIKFRQKRSGKCKTVCPFGKKEKYGDLVRVGSWLCYDCEHNENTNHLENFILCNHPKGEGDE